MDDARSQLFNEINMLLIKEGCSKELTDHIYIILHSYQVKNRCTEVAICDEDFNEQCIKKFLLSKTVAGCTKRTLEYYRREITKILEKIGKSVIDITPDDIRYYLAIRQAKDKVSRTTAGNEWRAISSFFTWLQREEIVLKNPIHKVESIRPEKKKKKAFSDIEVEKLRESARNAREKALVEVMLSTWCRVSELEGMKISDIEGDRMVVLGKGMKERTVYLNSKAQLAIEAYLKTRKDDKDHLFVSLDKPYNILLKSGIESTIRELGRNIGIDNCHPHRFRRTGATMALRNGMPIEKVSQILGHNSVSTTQIYLDISEEELQQAHKKYAR